MLASRPTLKLKKASARGLDTASLRAAAKPAQAPPIDTKGGREAGAPAQDRGAEGKAAPEGKPRATSRPRRLNRSLRRALYKRLIEGDLRPLAPALGQFLPLAIDCHRELIRRLKPVIKKCRDCPHATATVDALLGFHVATLAYKRAVAAPHSQRYDLDGRPLGQFIDDHIRAQAQAAIDQHKVYRFKAIDLDTIPPGCGRT